MLEGIFRRLEWSEKGINIDGKKFNDLRFADGVVVISETVEEEESMLTELYTESKKTDLKIHMGKTKAIFNN